MMDAGDTTMTAIPAIEPMTIGGMVAILKTLSAAIGSRVIPPNAQDNPATGQQERR